MILDGCGSGGAPVVVSVGDSAITSATVSHWMTVQAGGPASPSRDPALRAQALATLISTEWLIGEAWEQGMTPSREEVARQAAENEHATFPGGQQELQEFLKATGKTPSDLALEAESELASAAIQRRLASRQPAVGSTEVAQYYTRHPQSFYIPEQRDVLTTNRKSMAEAQAIRQVVASGKSFTEMSIQQTFERLTDTSPGDRVDIRIDAALQKAIYSARPNVLTGPVRLRADYYLIEVKHITPARFKPLTQVAASIKSKLTEERRQRALSAFIRAWRTKWTAQTNCHPGYIIQKCQQYTGPHTPENPPTLN